MIIRDETWEVFQIYLNQAIDYLESYENMDFEQCTLRDQLTSMLRYDFEEDNEE